MNYDPKRFFLESIDGPYRDRVREARRRRRIALAIYISIIVIVAVLVAYNVHVAHSQIVVDRWTQSWIPKDEVKRIMRYHGPFHRWRLTAGKLEFERGGKWIVAATRDGF